jgi:hypothetical protein
MNAVARERLQDIDILAAFNWRFADFVFKRDFPVATSMQKARAAGFGTRVNSAKMYTDFFAELQSLRVLPLYL